MDTEGRHNSHSPPPPPQREGRDDAENSPHGRGGSHGRMRTARGGMGGRRDRSPNREAASL